MQAPLLDDNSHKPCADEAPRIMAAPAIDNKALQYEILAQRIGEDVQANQAVIEAIENDVDNYRALVRSLQTLQTLPKEVGKCAHAYMHGHFF